MSNKKRGKGPVCIVLKCSRNEVGRKIHVKKGLAYFSNKAFVMQINRETNNYCRKQN